MALILGACGSQSATTASSTNATRATVSGSTAAPPPSPDLNRDSFRAPPALTSTQRSRLLRTGAVAIPVALGGPGRLTAFGQAELPHIGIGKVAHAAPLTATARGVVHLDLRLTPRAGHYLAAGHSFVMYVAIYFSKTGEGQNIPVPLTPSSARAH